MDVSKRLPAALGLVTARLKGQFGESHKDTGNVQKKQMEKLGLNPAGTDRGVEYSEYRRVKITKTIPLIVGLMKSRHPDPKPFWVFCTHE